MQTQSIEQARTTVLEVIKTVGDSIRELGSIPSGHLYARLMNYMTLDQHNQIIGTLKSAGLVKEEFHVLTWAGPKSS